MEFVVQNWESIALAIGVIVAITPTEKDNNVWSRVKNLLGKFMKGRK